MAAALAVSEQVGATHADASRGSAATRTISRATSALGSTPAIIGSVVVIVVWALCGPFAGFSNTWQLVINTGTTILTFNMVFVIQNTQNRDGLAVQVKLDAILHALDQADDGLMGIEELTEKEIVDHQAQVRAQAEPDPA
jgi:low affinity Fe/Cu permease